jgi:anhydro-N-acetylmuramic acid kinase
MGIDLVAKNRADRVLVSGGGVHNQTLMKLLQAELPQSAVESTSAVGVDPDSKEALFFALLAYETWHRRPGNLPSATGATKPVILGKISF